MLDRLTRWLEYPRLLGTCYRDNVSHLGVCLLQRHNDIPEIANTGTLDIEDDE